MSLPAALEFTLTALPGDYYWRLPVLWYEGIQRTLDDTLVMFDGGEPSLFPDLEVLEPEEQHEGLFPIEVRTVICIEPWRLKQWLPNAVRRSAFDQLQRPATDEDIAGVLYWGNENERWRLRRVCIGRYSRFEELDDTTELDSYGAFRDWLLVQENQYQAWTLYRDGWSDYNTTRWERMLPFLARWMRTHEDILNAAYPGRPVTAGSFDAGALTKTVQQATTQHKYGKRWTYRWDLEQGKFEEVGAERVEV